MIEHFFHVTGYGVIIELASDKIVLQIALTHAVNIRDPILVQGRSHICVPFILSDSLNLFPLDWYLVLLINIDPTSELFMVLIHLSEHSVE